MNEQDKPVTFVLHVGEPSNTGGFSAPVWKKWATWASRVVSDIVVYFSSAISRVPQVVADLGLTASKENFPDPEAPLVGLRITGRPSELESALRGLPFDPETGVTHMFCFAGERLIASIESDDGPNFLLLTLSPVEAKRLSEHLGDLTDNVLVCSVWAKVIDRMVDTNCGWIPLGANAQ
jgi:hypothetical protein